MANQYLFFLLDKKWRSVVFLSAFIVISTLFVLKPEMVWADGCGTSNSAVASETVSCGWMQYVGNAAVGPLGIDMALYLPSNTTGVTAIYAEYDDMGFSAMNGTQGILSTYSGDHTCYGRTNGSVSGNIPVQFFPGRNNNVNIYAYDTCGGYRGGKIIFQITHNLTPPVPTLSSFTITPNPVSYNSPTYLSWNTSGNVDYCEASDGWSGQKATSGSNVATPNLTTTTTFSLRCHGAGGWSPIQSVTVNVGAPPVPAVIFSASSSTIPYNTSVSLSWSASGVGVDYCTASNGWSGQKATSGSNVATPNLITTTTFSIQCHGTGGLSTVQSVIITVLDQVIPVPTLSSFTITPNPVSYNSPTYLSWNTSGNVDYCEASDGWSGQKATSGSNVATPNLTTTTTFSLRCHGAGGWSPIQSVTVNVGAQVVAPTFTFGANTTSVSYNAPAYLSWSTSGNADYCEASDGWSGQRGTSGSNVGISITGTTYFTLRCHGAGGWSPSQTIVVNVTYPTTPTIYYFAANSTSISYNTPAYLSWSASGDSDYCEASNGWSGQRATSGSGVAIYITGTTNFTLRCHGAGGWSPYQTVTVYTSNPVSSLFTVTFTVNGTTVPYNTPAYLSWNTSGSADYCEASNGWNGQRATSGSNVATQNLTGTTSFSIRCYGGGSWSPYQTVVVNVTSPTAPTISYFSVAPTTVSYNTPAYLSWSASGDSDYCEASNGWSGQRATSGSGVATPNLTTTTTFSLRCHGAGGWSPIQSVTVNVGARPIVQTAMLASIVPIISNAPKIKIETPAIKLACNPGTCVGYHGVAQGGVGSLNVISSPQNGAYVSCGVQIDNEKQKAVQCDKSLSVLVSDRNVGAHTFILTNVDASGNKKKTTLFFRIKENIKPKLTCSFDAITWKPCKEIQPTVGVGVYVRDTSLPSTGARITSRKLQAIPGVQPGAVAAELALFKPTSSGVKLIQLSVSDSAGRTGNVVDLLYVKEGPANVCKPVEILSTTVK